MKVAGIDILEALIEHELAVKRLYETFAADFTDRQEFWQTLAGAEQRHADKLGKHLGALSEALDLEKRLGSQGT
ncbi:MAG: hypothetical protein ABH877_01085 [bacterium]